LHATFIINKLPTQVLNNLSPHFILHNAHPDMHSLKVFGSLAFASTLHMHRTKLEPRGRKCVFLGYKNGMKGVVLYDINSHTILVSRNGIHHVHIFPIQMQILLIGTITHTKIPLTHHNMILSYLFHHKVLNPLLTNMTIVLTQPLTHCTILTLTLNL
jgi:hypothetical protein